MTNRDVLIFTVRRNPYSSIVINTLDPNTYGIGILSHKLTRRQGYLDRVTFMFDGLGSSGPLPLDHKRN